MLKKRPAAVTPSLGRQGHSFSLRAPEADDGGPRRQLPQEARGTTEAQGTDAPLPSQHEDQRGGVRRWSESVHEGQEVSTLSHGA